MQYDKPFRTKSAVCDAYGCTKTALDVVGSLLQKIGLKMVFIPTGGDWYEFYIVDFKRRKEDE